MASSCLCSSSGRAPLSYGEGRRFEAVQRLHMLVPQQVDGLVESQVDAGSTPAERTRAALAHLARARSLYLRGSGFETCTRLVPS
jgi:hypothetical protein